jgi:hypothetical protein
MKLNIRCLALFSCMRDFVLGAKPELFPPEVHVEVSWAAFDDRRLRPRPSLTDSQEKRSGRCREVGAVRVGPAG